ncbi:MAG: hypothetical protein H0T80_04030 [Betaproteobacteria bacterium]|nr:hypothetical protein [Betaproteobacteria bacterium]
MTAEFGTAISNPPIDHEWLAKYREAILDPALPIIDPHHHLWDLRS